MDQSKLTQGFKIATLLNERFGILMMEVTPYSFVFSVEREEGIIRAYPDLVEEVLGEEYELLALDIVPGDASEIPGGDDVGMEVVNLIWQYIE